MEPVAGTMSAVIPIPVTPGNPGTGPVEVMILYSMLLVPAVDPVKLETVGPRMRTSAPCAWAIVLLATSVRVRHVKADLTMNDPKLVVNVIPREQVFLPLCYS